MADAREAIKEHYNQHVAEGISTREALARRREGPAAPLKRFHNEIKRRLIYRFAFRAESLLDYACGRGGDLHKWRSAQVGFVKGLDLSPREVEEARRRYGELLAKEPGCPLRAEFHQTDGLGLAVADEGRRFDVATCMFALHYFFEQEAVLAAMMETVALNLKPGGFFIGCVPDGKRVKAHLARHGGQLAMDHLVLKQEWEGKDTPFGSAYVMTIPDTVVEGHQGLTEGSREFLVYDKVLVAVARKCGLHPVVDFSDPSLDALFEEADASKPMKHFNPQYPSDNDNSLALASRLYMAFVFQKASSPEDVAAPPLPPPEARGGGGGGGRQQQGPPPRRKRSRSRSPSRAERFAALDGPGEPAPPGPPPPPPLQQQQQQQQQQQPPPMPWGGGGGRNRHAHWDLPYQARVLPPQDLPSAFANLKPQNLAVRQSRGRFVIHPPELPPYAGPVQLDPMTQQPVYQQLPNGSWVHSYYDELNYHATEQQKQQAQAAQQQQQQHPQPQPQPQQQPQQQQHPPPQQRPGGGGGSGGRGGLPAVQQGPRQGQQPPQQQQQQSDYPPPPGQPAAAQPEKQQPLQQQQQQQQQQPGGGASPSPGKAKGAKAVSATATAAATAPPADGDAEGSMGAQAAAATPSRGGKAGGRATGAKRTREQQGAADAGAGAGEGPPDDGGGPGASKRHAAPGAGVAGSGGGARPAGGRGPGRAMAADPVGYKAAAAAELPPQLVESLSALGPQYAER